MGANTTINIKSSSTDIETIRSFISEALKEERKKIEYALEVTIAAIKRFEEKFGLTTNMFLKDFKEGNIEESEETFEWWAEAKLENELRKKLEMIEGIEICQQ